MESVTVAVASPYSLYADTPLTAPAEEDTVTVELVTVAVASPLLLSTATGSVTETPEILTDTGVEGAIAACAAMLPEIRDAARSMATGFSVECILFFCLCLRNKSRWILRFKIFPPPANN